MSGDLIGGDRLAARLEQIRQQISAAGKLRVGFLEGSTYPDGTPVPYIAALNEYGATINVEARQQTIYRSIRPSGEFNKNGRFVKKSASNFATTHDVAAHTITIPSRPYFRNMIAACSPEWGKTLARLMKQTNYDVAKSYALMGEIVKGQLQQSIRDFSDPANAPRTVAKKGFNDPLIDTGHMMNSVDYEVSP